MDNPEPCPSPQELAGFMRGELQPELRARLTTHINQCSLCQGALQKSSVKYAASMPTLSPGLRTPAVAAAGSDANVTKVGFRSTPAPAGDKMSGSDTYVQAPGGGVVQTPPTLSGKATQVEATFLRPPAGPGEIGRIGNYRVLGLLGAGGMGMVFRAEDLVLGRPVALKIIRPDLREQEEGWQRLQREARLLAQIKHDNLVTLYQAGEENEVFYLAMELLEGESLEDRLKRENKLSLPEILRLSREIAAGLAAIHASNLIHRDIKPSNIWLEGKAGRAKILDFGLARSVHGGNNSTLTQAGTVVGTPAYMSPEQARGDKLDPRSDLFSYGSVVYCMCAGKTPFAGESLIAQLTALAVDIPPPLHTIESRIPKDLSDLLVKLLEKKPSARPASAEDVIARLEEIAGINPSQRIPPLPRKPLPSLSPKKKPAAKKKENAWIPVAVAILLFGFLAGGAKLMWPSKQAATDSTPKEPVKVADAGNINKTPELPVTKVDTTGTKPALNRPPDEHPVRTEDRKPPNRQPPDDRPPQDGPPDERRRPPPRDDDRPPEQDGPRRPAVFLAAEKAEEVRGIVKAHLAAFAKGESTYALDLKIVDQNNTYLPKASGKTGKVEGPGPPDAFRTFSLVGENSPHAIGMHPNPDANGYIDLKLDKKFKTFRAIVTQNDNLPNAASGMIFSVYGDEKLLWRSQPVLSQKETQPIPPVDVTGVSLLTLELKPVGGGMNGLHALWFEPFLQK